MSYLKLDKVCTSETTAREPCTDSLRVEIVHTYISRYCRSVSPGLFNIEVW